MTTRIAIFAALVLSACASSGPEPRPGETTTPPTQPAHETGDPGNGPAKAQNVPAGGATKARGAEPTSPVYRVEAEGSSIRVSTEDGRSATFSLSLLTRASAREWTESPRVWQRSETGFQTAIEGPGWRWSIGLETDGTRPRLGLRVDVEYLVDVEIDHEEVHLVFQNATGHEVLGRDLVLRAVQGEEPHVTDPWTPLEVSTRTPLGPMTLIRSNGFPSAVTEGAETGLAVHLELDDRGNHPYQPYTKCHERYASRLPQHDLWSSLRRSGDRVSHRAEIWIGDASPLRIERLPEGKRAAVVFTSHADQSKVPTTSAILWGHSNPAHPTYGKRGMIGHGLTLTLTAWASRGRYTDISDPRFLEILQHADQAGVEVSPHSTTPYPEDRETLARHLERYGEFRPATWIDHQPETNCEALNNGAGISDGDSRYDVVDVLHDAGLRYFWSIPDVNPPGGIDILGSSRTSYRPTLMYRNPRLKAGGEPIWMFKSCWRFLKSRVFLEWYNQQKIQRLIDERGIHVAHVYLDFYEATGRLADRPIVEPDGQGFRLGDEADRMFQRLGKLQRDKSLWVTSMRDLGDHLSAISELSVDYLPDGTARIKAGRRSIKMLSITVPVTEMTIGIDGGPPDGARWGRQETTFWMDLPAGKARTVSLDSEGGRKRLMPRGSTIPVAVGGG